MADDKSMAQTASQLMLTKFDATRAAAVRELALRKSADALLRLYSGEIPPKAIASAEPKAEAGADPGKTIFVLLHVSSVALKREMQRQFAYDNACVNVSILRISAPPVPVPMPSLMAKQSRT